MMFALYFVVFAYVYLAIRRRRIWLADLVVKSIAIILPTLAIMSFWLIPMFQLAARHPDVGGTGHNTYVADMAAYLVPGIYHWLGNVNPFGEINAAYTGNFWETSTYLGWVCALLFAFTIRKTRAVSAKYLLAALPFLLLSFGVLAHLAGNVLPIYLPDVVARFLPLLRSVRSPGRYAIYVGLFWSVLIPIAVGWLYYAARGLRWRKAAIAVVLCLMVADFWPVRIESTPVTCPPCYAEAQSESERIGILELPLGYAETNRYMMNQTFHRLPLVNGWASRRFERSLLDSLDFNDLSGQQTQLEAGRVKYVMIHKPLSPESGIDTLKYLRQYTAVRSSDECLVLRVY
jgi:hypothetical protein